MAGELDVNRATLYRWVGSRETLLVDLVWALAEQTLADVEAETGGRGMRGAPSRSSGCFCAEAGT